MENQMPSQHLGVRLRHFRQEAGLTQPELAQGITSPSHISLIESGLRHPSAEVVAQLALRLNISERALTQSPESSSIQSMRKDLLFAEMALTNNDAKFASVLLKKLVAEFPAEGDLEFRSNIEATYAKSLEMLGDLEKALFFFRQSRTYAESAGLPLRVIELTIDISRCERNMGDFVTALELLDEAKKNFPIQLQKSATYARLLSSMIAVHHLRGDYARAFDVATNSIKLFDEETDAIARASVLWNASLAADGMQDTATALILAQRAAGLFSEADDSRAEGNLRIAIAWLMTRQSPPDSIGARQQLVKANQLLENIGTSINFANLETELARVEWLDGEYELALTQAKSAIARLETTGERLQRAEAYLLAARAQISLGNDIESSMNLIAARSSLSQMEPSRQNALVWRELGDIYAGLGHLDEAISAYREALVDAGVPASTIAYIAAKESAHEIHIR
ncbi:MAG: helix-turn-helix domain-containing protein [Actinomycetes bacterium]